MVDLNLKSLFLRAILGDDTAKALAKAIVRCPELEGVVIPRAALSWVSLASSGYSGVIPGVEGTGLVLIKGENGLSGKISSNGHDFTFKDESVYFVAAATVCALGLDTKAELPTSSKISDLGKSLDLMIKARVAVDNLKKMDKPGGVQAPKAPTPPVAPTAIQPLAGKPKKMGAGPKIGQGAPKTMVPNKTASTPGLNTTQPKLKKSGIKILRRHLDTICGVCDSRQFTGEKFTSCVCFPDLEKSTKVIKSGNGYEIQFGAGWDIDLLRAFLSGLE